MEDRRLIHHIAALAIVFSLFISGCMSTPPPQITPAQTATPVPGAPVINVTSYPESIDADTNLSIDWEVVDGAPGNIIKTAIIWGFKEGSPAISDYEGMSTVQTGKTPQQFNATLNAPSNGTIYFRAYAVVDGTDVYSKEYRTEVVPPNVSGEY